MFYAHPCINDKTNLKMGDGEKLNQWESLEKLNRWKICMSSFLSAERSPCKNVGNWKFFRMIDIKEMAAIFQFFHNGQH